MDDPESAGLVPAETLVIVVGLEMRLLFDGAMTSETAAEAVMSSVPQRVSHEGNIFEVVNAWEITPSMLEEMYNRDNRDEPADDGSAAAVEEPAGKQDGEDGRESVGPDLPEGSDIGERSRGHRGKGSRDRVHRDQRSEAGSEGEVPVGDSDPD